MTKNQLILNRNEMLYAPAPACIQALHNFNVEHIYRYIPDYYTSVLIPELAKEYKVAEDAIMTFYGIEDGLRVLFDRIGPGQTVLMHELHYKYYDLYTEHLGLKVATFSLRDEHPTFVFDVDDFLNKYRSVKPKMVLLTSPNNPTGTIIPIVDLETMLEGVSSDCLVAIDNAYFGFGNDEYDRDLIKLTKKYSNLIVLRTLSKKYALAGLRIGFAICGKEVKKMLRYQNRYLGLSRISEEVAVAALHSPEYYQQTTAAIINDRDQLINICADIKSIHAYGSGANFFLIKVDDGLRKRFNTMLDQQPTLLFRRITDQYYRVSIGLPEHTKSCADLLRSV